LVPEVHARLHHLADGDGRVEGGLAAAVGGRGGGWPAARREGWSTAARWEAARRGRGLCLGRGLHGWGSFLALLSAARVIGGRNPAHGEVGKGTHGRLDGRVVSKRVRFLPRFRQPYTHPSHGAA